MIIHPDRDYTYSYITSQRRYAHLKHAIYPERVYADPLYPRKAVIAELPYAFPFRCEQVFWHTSRLSHRLPIYRPDHLEFFAIFSSTDMSGKVLFEIVFIGYDVFTIFQKWLYFIDTHGHKLLAQYYQKNPVPQHSPDTYEATHLNYDHGCVFADHAHLRKIMTGIRVG